MTDDAHARPADFDPERLDGQHTLVLGAPYLGKSHRVRESDHDHERVMRLDAALEAREGAFVVVDEFYTAYRGATEETRRAFRSWLDREGGVCVVARPRELDWLLDSDETPLSSAFLDAFDDIRLLRYRPDEESDRERAVDCCRSILDDQAEESPPREDIEEMLDTLCRTTDHRFDSAALRERLSTDSYGATLVPALVVYFSDRLADGDGAFVPSELVDVHQRAPWAGARPLHEAVLPGDAGTTGLDGQRRRGRPARGRRSGRGGGLNGRRRRCRRGARSSRIGRRRVAGAVPPPP